MSKISIVLGATCLACLTSMAAAQSTGPTHPATGGDSAAASSAQPPAPPTHPATGASGATPESAAAGTQNPSVNGYKDSQPAADAGRRAPSKAAPAGDMTRHPTSTDSMAQDNKPKHPAAETKQ